MKALASSEADENETQVNQDSSFDPSSRSPGTCVPVIVIDENRTVNSSENSETRPEDHESVASSDTEDSTLKTTERSPADHAKFATLKRALATISAEKSRQEVAFTEDRKRLIVRFKYFYSKSHFISFLLSF